MSLLSAVVSARVLDLAQPLQRGMPQSPNHPPFRLALERRHGDVIRVDGGSAANEIIVTGGHVGTHVDGLAHVSFGGRLHGGVDAAAVQTNDGFTRLGVDQFTPYVGRAVLLDVTAVHGTGTLPAGYEVTPEDLDAALARTSGVQPGDVILIGTGWSRCWAEREKFVGHGDGAPGPGKAAGEWLAQWQPTAVGGETIAFERVAAGLGHSSLPVHRLMLVDQGINIVETMRLHPLLDMGVSEFVLVLNPLLIVGATGAPVRPLALIG